MFVHVCRSCIEFYLAYVVVLFAKLVELTLWLMNCLGTGLRDTSSSISVTATLENAQRIVSKIPQTAANEEDIAPLIQEFEDLTAQLQTELDKLSAATSRLGPSRL